MAEGMYTLDASAGAEKSSSFELPGDQTTMSPDYAFYIGTRGISLFFLAQNLAHPKFVIHPSSI